MLAESRLHAPRYTSRRMTLPTSIEFAAAFNHLTDVLAAKLGITPEQVSAALLTHEGSESLELLYDAWLEHDDTLDFDDEEEDQGDDWDDYEDDETDEAL